VSDLKTTENIVWHEASVSTEDRRQLNGHQGATLWFTGLSGSGKSTLSNAVAVALHLRGVHTYVLDGDNIRHGLNKGLGFSEEDRRENIRRIAEVAKLFTDAQIVNLTAFISPFRADREFARSIQPEKNQFLEIFVKASLDTCRKRDPKGLYEKAAAGEIKNFTGIDSPYEEPDSPELTVDTDATPLEQCVDRVVSILIEKNIIPK